MFVSGENILHQKVLGQKNRLIVAVGIIPFHVLGGRDVFEIIDPYGGVKLQLLRLSISTCNDQSAKWYRSIKNRPFGFIEDRFSEEFVKLVAVSFDQVRVDSNGSG